MVVFPGANCDLAEIPVPGYKNRFNGDVFLAKYNTAGECMWAQNFGSHHKDAGRDIAFDPTGPYVYLTGTFKKVVDFDPAGKPRNGAEEFYSCLGPTEFVGPYEAGAAGVAGTLEYLHASEESPVAEDSGDESELALKSLS